MKIFAITTIAALALAGSALAKGHDQGANGDDGRTPGDSNAGGAKAVIDFLEGAGVLDGKGVSAAVKGGQQGAESSGGKSKK